MGRAPVPHPDDLEGRMCIGNTDLGQYTDDGHECNLEAECAAIPLRISRKG